MVAITEMIENNGGWTGICKEETGTGERTIFPEM